MTGRGIAFAALAIVAVLAVGWLAPSHRPAPVAPPTTLAAVSAGGITLTSDAITLPEETAALPAGNDLITVNCTACHSAELITTQPALSAEKWQAEVEKMRAVYKAQIAPDDDTALVAALVALPTQRVAK